MADDEALFDAWASGSTEAGEALLQRHFEAVYRFFHNKAGADIDDLVQDTFADCLEAHGRFAGRSSFRAFLLGIARHKLLHWYRRQARQRGTQGDGGSVHDLGTSFSDAVEREQEQRVLLRALRQIPLESQILLELVFWESLSDREVADLCEIPHGTAKSRIRKARLALREKIEQVLNTSQFDSTTDDIERWIADMRRRQETR